MQVSFSIADLPREVHGVVGRLPPGEVPAPVSVYFGVVERYFVRHHLLQHLITGAVTEPDYVSK